VLLRDDNNSKCRYLYARSASIICSSWQSDYVAIKRKPRLEKIVWYLNDTPPLHARTKYAATNNGSQVSQVLGSIVASFQSKNRMQESPGRRLELCKISHVCQRQGLTYQNLTAILLMIIDTTNSLIPHENNPQALAQPPQSSSSYYSHASPSSAPHSPPHHPFPPFPSSPPTL
jgi:hypothetical protein